MRASCLNMMLTSFALFGSFSAAAMPSTTSLSLSLAAGPVLLSLFAPAFVSASRGNPEYNATEAAIEAQKPKPKLPTYKNPPVTNGPNSYASKKGIVFVRGGESDASEFTSQSQVGWAYNWYPTTSGLSGDIEFIPMLWTLYSSSDSGTQNDWNYATESNMYGHHALGYNEPDEGSSVGGSNIDASVAAAAWPGDMDYHGIWQTDRSQFYIGSPAIAAGDYSWFDTFLNDCDNCEFDFFAVHWYGDCNVNDFTGYLQQYQSRYMGNGQPMWVTEFGFLNCASDSAEADQIVAAVNWLESQSWIERYAYWGNLGTASSNKGGLGWFLNNDNSWTCQGYAYVNADNPC